MRRSEVQRLRRSIVEEALSDDDVRLFLQGLLRSFTPAAHFHGDVALAAIAVALEPIATDLASEFIGKLSSLRVAELPLSPRVARLVVESRRARIADDTVRTARVAQEARVAEGPISEDDPTALPASNADTVHLVQP
jgi:hypothetical protein